MALKAIRRKSSQRWAIPESWRHRWLAGGGLIVGELPDVFVLEPTPWPPPASPSPSPEPEPPKEEPERKRQPFRRQPVSRKKRGDS